MSLPDLNLLSPSAADRLERESLDAYPAPGLDAGAAPELPRDSILLGHLSDCPGLLGTGQCDCGGPVDAPELISLPEPEPLPEECGEAAGTRTTGLCSEGTHEVVPGTDCPHCGADPRCEDCPGRDDP
jgi:hypothetical protein